MKLQLYILRQLLVGLAFAVGGILVIALPGIAVGAVHRLPNADALVLMSYVPIVVQAITPHVLPICFLLAVVATYGRLAADREWTAIQMAGVQPLKMLAPAAGLALVLGAGTLWMVSDQLPRLKTEQRQFLINASTSSIENLRPGRTSLRIGEFVLEALWQDQETGLLHEVYVRRPGARDGEETRDYHAKTADLSIIEGVLLATLTGLYVVEAGAGPGAEASQQYHEYVQLEFPLSDYIEGRAKVSTRARYQTSRELRRRLAAGEVSRKSVAGYRFELQNRWALSAAYLLFVGLGVPTGLILRRGTQLSALAASSGYGLLYYLLNMRLAKELGTGGHVPPAVGAWTPTILGALVSLPLLRRALRR